MASVVDDLQRDEPTEYAKIAIADCVLEWARLESHLRAVLTALEGRPLDEGARQYGRLSPDDAWKRIKRELRNQHASESVIEAVQRNREASRTFYQTRKHITHSGLVGSRRSDPLYLAFAPFESDRPGEMVFLWIPISDFERSAHFARSANAMVARLMSQLGF
jgi:hypothetical protein